MLKRAALVAAAALLLLILLGASVFAPPFGEHWAGISTDEKVVALTYDDGPNPPHTQALLRVLARAQVPATFYFMGAHVEAHEASARTVIAAGHEVGNHSWSHAPLPLLSVAGVRDEFERTDAILRRLGVSGPIDVRAPWMLRGLQAAWWFSRAGRRHIGAGAAGNDWEPSTAREVADRVLASVKPGTIILLHDGDHASLAADRSWTVGATQILLKELGSQGYRFVRVSELIALAAR
jgi:peptidoglycan/xylan/chitin deacetylase (PgdA/CDA1 family)